jgi:hypothetical protein
LDERVRTTIHISYALAPSPCACLSTLVLVNYSRGMEL